MTDKLTHDVNACISCGACASSCPKKVVKMSDNKPLLCNTCDGEPTCVSICPHGALQYA